jgi:N-acetylglucosaminyldiphosphoundecaprenol N-acetyl-beta-D-mannosaminyltransferase
MKAMRSKKKPESVYNNNGDYREMWGIPLLGRGMEGVLSKVETILSGKEKIYWIATVNPEFIMLAKKDAGFRAILKKTDLNVVDGIGIIWAEKIKDLKSKVQKIITGFRVGVEVMQGKHREGLVTGVDLMDRLCRLAEEKNKTVYFYGGWGDRAGKTAEYFGEKYPRLKVAGSRAEDFDFGTEADILFVARGMKKQEEWIGENLEKLKVRMVMGVGRSFDYYSGELPRAPEWMRKMGLEWLYSLIKEPKRWKRQLQLPKFIWEVLKNID